MTKGPAAPLHRYHEIVVRMAPSERQPGSAPSARMTSGGGVPWHYDAWIYTKLPLPVELGKVEPASGSGAPPPEVGGLPLIGHEEITVTWLSYGEYLSLFYGGEESMLELRRRGGGAISSGLRGLLQLKPRPERRLRLWWSSQSPELEDLPWEILELGGRRPPRFSIVRGSPGKAAPPLPVPDGEPLRIAVIDPAGGAPVALSDALGSLGPGIEVVWIEQDDPSKAIAEAIAAGCEVLHLVADGVVPFGLEGLLDLSGDDDATISPRELAAMLRGSRVAVLALTPPESPRIGHLGMPTVFHAFARFGHDSGEGPTIVAQIGPMSPPVSRDFWRAFYERLAASFDVEEAMSSAAQRPLVTPVVVFLRHRLGRQFCRPDDPALRCPVWTTAGTGQTPADQVLLTVAQVTADLSITRDLLDAARRLETRYASLGLDFPGTSAIAEEHKRQSRLDEVVDESSERLLKDLKS
ncbi:uncharacterized protein SOCE26_023340 [Sorangium cellulosum]|uniref:Uncharacterized protein n=1 Tax=Sorangium cellulosum TaxID=56 RepID=A0A2L0ENV2_SORCE|nr:hypothetical protein [Sorangium cellulosum]AUX40932.1 uncharacterized protein SOCE26_023340 [Sorangium cellulosum]